MNLGSINAKVLLTGARGLYNRTRQPGSGKGGNFSNRPLHWSHDEDKLGQSGLENQTTAWIMFLIVIDKDTLEVFF